MLNPRNSTNISHPLFCPLHVLLVWWWVLSLMISSTFLASELYSKVMGFISEIHAQIRHFLFSITAKKGQREMFYLTTLSVTKFMLHQWWMDAWMNEYIHTYHFVAPQILPYNSQTWNLSERERERTHRWNKRHNTIWINKCQYYSLHNQILCITSYISFASLITLFKTEQ